MCFIVTFCINEFRKHYTDNIMFNFQCSGITGSESLFFPRELIDFWDCFKLTRTIGVEPFCLWAFLEVWIDLIFASLAFKTLGTSAVNKARWLIPGIQNTFYLNLLKVMTYYTLWKKYKSAAFPNRVNLKIILYGIRNEHLIKS